MQDYQTIGGYVVGFCGEKKEEKMKTSLKFLKITSEWAKTVADGVWLKFIFEFLSLVWLTTEAICDAIDMHTVQRFRLVIDSKRTLL